ncbi:hypothetical protein [Actinoplanes sp. NPDC049316]|uniref:hypothetical protein n=1 Tax=Actinoplanes sp. NPDC049316 TaxID=3154727 RepID=UPI003444C4AC
MIRGMLLCFGSAKSSPGTTTLAVAMAARWPHPGSPPVVVELDAAGGDLGSRWATYDEPGLASLASGASGASDGPVGDGSAFVQHLRVGADVIVAPPSAAAAATVEELRLKGPGILRELAAVRPVFADLGRLDTQATVLGYLDKADELLLVARPEPAQLRHLRMRLPVLRRRCPAVRLVLVGDGPHEPEEIADYLQIEVATTIPYDPVAADIVAGRKRPRRWGQSGARREAGWTRRPLLAAARTFALTYQPNGDPESETAEAGSGTSTERARQTVEVTS